VHIACWINKAADTHSEYVIFTAFSVKNGYANAPECFIDAHIECLVKRKGKAIPLQAWTGPEGSRRLRLPDFKTIDTRKYYVVRLSVLRTGRLYPPGNIPGTHLC